MGHFYNNPLFKYPGVFPWIIRKESSREKEIYSLQDLDGVFVGFLVKGKSKISLLFLLCEGSVVIPVLVKHSGAGKLGKEFSLNLSLASHEKSTKTWIKRHGSNTELGPSGHPSEEQQESLSFRERSASDEWRRRVFGMFISGRSWRQKLLTSCCSFRPCFQLSFIHKGRHVGRRVLSQYNAGL